MPKSKVIRFKPIPAAGYGGAGHITLEIYPPNEWMRSPLYHAFVGGNGVGTATTVEDAKKLLLDRARETLVHRQAEYQRQADHFAGALKTLNRKGLVDA